MHPSIEVEPLPAGLGLHGVQVGRIRSNPAVGWLELARPEKFNAFNEAMWKSFPKAVELLDMTPGIQVVVVSGQGKNFCAGIDVSYLAHMMGGLQAQSCPGLLREELRRNILKLQDAYTCLERCRLPVVAAVHGACIGAGVDLITACDIRLCSEDATFCVKEVDLAITADLGTLQRLPHIVGHGAAMDMALTAAMVPASRALQLGLVTRVVPASSSGSSSREDVLRCAADLAQQLAAKPGLALRGTKKILLQARDQPRVSDGLEAVATWNSALLLSKELEEAVQGQASRAQRPRKPTPKL